MPIDGVDREQVGEQRSAWGDGVNGHRAAGGSQHPLQGGAREGGALHEPSGSSAEDERLDLLPAVADLEILGVRRGAIGGCAGGAAPVVGTGCPPAGDGLGAVEVAGPLRRGDQRELDKVA
jgi:hypothetical protein